MKIDGGASYLFASQHAQAKSAARFEAKGAFDALLAKETERSEPTVSVTIEQTDFTNMTRQGLHDWMNEQLRSGNMTVDESTAFLGLGGLVRADGGAVGDRWQGERVNFIDLAQNNLAFYLQRGDQAAADRLQKALDLMAQSQGQIARFDARL